MAWSVDRSRNQTLYVVNMHILIVSSSLAAFLFIRLNEIPFSLFQVLMGFMWLFYYINAVCARPEVPEDSDTFAVACASHVFGIALVVCLSNVISPMLALCVGIPASVWFIALCCYGLNCCVVENRRIRKKIKVVPM